MIFIEATPKGAVEIVFDKEGLEDLRLALSQLETKPNHTHMFSPAFGGHELSEDVPTPDYFVVHKLTLRRVQDASQNNT